MSKSAVILIIISNEIESGRSVRGVTPTYWMIGDGTRDQHSA